MSSFYSKVSSWHRLNENVPLCFNGTFWDGAANCLARAHSLASWATKGLWMFCQRILLITNCSPASQIFISYVLRYSLRNKEHARFPQEIVSGSKMDYSCCAGGFSLWKMIWAKVSPITTILVSGTRNTDWPYLGKHLTTHFISCARLEFLSVSIRLLKMCFENRTPQNANDAAAWEFKCHNAT